MVQANAQVLDTILAYKRREVEAAKSACPPAAMRARAEAATLVRPFADAIAARLAASEFALIAEIKRRSPSAGCITCRTPSWPFATSGRQRKPVGT
jgi:indole-3-glycerol phosphate synthase